MIAAFAVLAFAGSELAVTEGPLRPGRPATIEVGSVSEGIPRSDPPRLTASGGSLSGPTAERPGVWRWRLIPAIDADQVRLDLDGTPTTLPVAPPPKSSLVVPDVVDVVVPAAEVSFVVAGDKPPPPDAIEVVPAEGHVASIASSDRGLEVKLALDDRPFPRWVPVAVLDRRKDEQPAWVLVRVRARPRIPLVAEAGAKLVLKVGSRTYGPFVAGADGQIDARIDQYPGDLAASATLSDDLGNQTHTEVPLIGQTAPSVLAVASGELLPGRRLPLVYLRAVTPDGTASLAVPSCKAPAGSLPTRAVGPGTWLVPLPPTDDPVDVRIACGVDAASAEVRVAMASDVPSRIGLRVWPDELQTDFPVAEVSVVLDDARGERIPVDRVQVRADRGEVSLEPGSGMVAHGEYDGKAAVEGGEDRIHASWTAPSGSGPVEEVALGWGAVPQGAGPLLVYARALDPLRRPLAGSPVTIRVNGQGGAGQELALTTSGDGWARGTVDLGARGKAGGVLVLEAASGAAIARAIAIPGDPAHGGPDVPDLAADQSVRLRPGRVSGISIEVDPPQLRAGPGAVAMVYVRLEDGAGQPVTDEPPTIDATEGTVTNQHVRPDGTWVAEYTPSQVEHQRQIELTARTSTVRSSAHLELEPRLVRVSFGPWIGARSNFGQLNAPTAGFDFDFRIRSKLIGESVTFRIGGSVAAFRADVLTGLGPSVTLRTTMIPFDGAMLFRRDLGSWALWGGGGLIVGPMFETSRFNQTADGIRTVVTGQNWLLGPVLMGGVAVRAPLGEVVFGLQGSWVPAPRADLGYRGNLGGLAGGVGYRLVY